MHVYAQAYDKWWKYKGLDLRFKVQAWTNGSDVVDGCQLAWSQDLITWNLGTAFNITSTKQFQYIDFYNVKGFNLDDSGSNIFVGIVVPGTPTNASGITFYMDNYSLLTGDSAWYWGNKPWRSRDRRAEDYKLYYWEGSIKTAVEETVRESLRDRFTPAQSRMMDYDKTFIPNDPVIAGIEAISAQWLAGGLQNWSTTLVVNGQYISLSQAGTIYTYTVGTNPLGLAIDASGNIWVANNTGNTVTKLSASGVLIGTFAVGGGPSNIAIDSAGNAWVTNYVDSTVIKLSPSGSALGTYAVGSNPRGIAIDSAGNVWVVNSGAGTVTKLSPSGSVLGTYTVGSSPRNIVIDSAGNVWVTNFSSNTVTKMNLSGSVLGTYSAGTGPMGIAVDSSGNVWITNNATAGTVTKMSVSGSVLGTYTVGANPWGVAIDASGNIWVANFVDSTVMKLNAAGSIVQTFTGFNGSAYIAIGLSGNVWVTDESTTEVSKIIAGTPDSVYVGADGYYTVVDNSKNFSITFFVTVSGMVNGSYPITVYQGRYGEIGAFGGTTTNMQVVSRPRHFSYVQPTVVSNYTETIVIYLSGGNYYGNLSYTSAQTGVLLRNGIPLPVSVWSFVSATQIQINASEYDSAAVYTIQYDTQIEYDSAVIDLGTTYLDLIWRPMWYAWNRKNMTAYSVARTETINVAQNGVATLSYYADGVQTNAQLVQVLNGVETTIPTTSWAFGSDNKSVVMDVRKFSEQAEYVFTYNMVVPRRDNGATITVQIAWSDNGTTWSSWLNIERGQVVEYHRYWKYKVVCTGVQNTADIRLRSLVMASYQYVSARV